MYKIVDTDSGYTVTEIDDKCTNPDEIGKTVFESYNEAVINKCALASVDRILRGGRKKSEEGKHIL